MIEIDTSQLIGKGSNSKVYSCLLDGREYAAKVPHNAERYISCALQVDSLITCQKANTSFVTPNVIQYEAHHDNWGEVLVMDKLNKIYPISFLIRKGMLDREYIISCAAKAIAQLHSLSISGFDIEFYWSYEHKKLALLDLGPRYTIGYTCSEMVAKHYEYAIINQNWMATWNLVSELLDSNEALDLFSEIVHGNKIPPIEKLQRAICEFADQEHIQGVARNHYLQLIGDCPKYLQKKMTNLFIKKYIASTKAPSHCYAGAFESAYKEDIKSNIAYLYISNNSTVSKMSNSVSIL